MRLSVKKFLRGERELFRKWPPLPKDLVNTAVGGEAMGSIEKYLEELLDSLEDEVADTFLDAQLHLMKALFAADPSYRKNIENFQGTYWFASKDGDINRIVRFAGAR